MQRADSSATHCTTLHHTATHCNTLQHTATQIAMNASELIARDRSDYQRLLSLLVGPRGKPVIDTYIYLYIHIHIYVCICICVHICRCICVYIYIYTDECICIHRCILTTNNFCAFSLVLEADR